MDLLDHLTELDVFSSDVDDYCLTNVPKVHNDETVEGRLWSTLKTLAATEGKIYLFHTLKSKGLATNDVRNFSIKQTIHKKVNKGIDSKVRRTAMQSKLADALAYASRLRQQKSSLKKQIQKKHKGNKSKCKKILHDLQQRYRRTRVIEMDEADKKIVHLSEKDMRVRVSKEAPRATRAILDGVNVFCDGLPTEPEAPEGPMICDSTLKFDMNELKVLAKGPKFMVREELQSEDFKVELEKMIVKQKFDERSKDAHENKDDCSEKEKNGASLSSASTAAAGTSSKINLDSNGEGVRDLNCLWEEQAGLMVYNSKSKSLNLGNLRATNYKHNKRLYLPNNSKVEHESSHETRRVEMLRVFNRVRNENPNKDSYRKSLDCNLTNDELQGLKSLRERVKNGSLIVASTDKSKRFALLSRQ